MFLFLIVIKTPFGLIKIKTKLFKNNNLFPTFSMKPVNRIIFCIKKML